MSTPSGTTPRGDVGSARKIKDQLKGVVSDEPWLVGMGVEREDGIGFIVRMTVKRGAAADARAKVTEALGAVATDDASLRINGVFVKIVEGD